MAHRVEASSHETNVGFVRSIKVTDHRSPRAARQALRGEHTLSHRLDPTRALETRLLQAQQHQAFCDDLLTTLALTVYGSAIAIFVYCYFTSK